MNTKISCKDYKLAKSKTNLNIAIEAFPLSEENLTGIGVTTKRVLENLQLLDTTNNYIVYFKDKNRNLDIKNPKWRVVTNKSEKLWLKKSTFCSVAKKNPTFINKITYYLFWLLCKLVTVIYTIQMPFHLSRNKVDVYIGFSHSYMPIFFIGKNIKKTVFLYDMVWKILPETMAPSNRIKMQLLSSYNLKRTDFLISISDNTKQDFLKFFNYKKNIYTIHLAVDKKTYHLASPDNITIVKDKFNLPDSYVLAVGTIEPRKNLITLLKAFSILNNKNIHLVLVGKIGWIDNNFFELLDQYKIKNRVVFTGYVSDKFLAPLYSGAKMFVFPSIYEGFGLPILEAMQCGCPVIASNNSSIPEVAGDAALLFDANDYTELARLIDKLLQDENLRKSYIAKGFEQVKKFSWEKTVAQLLNVIESEYNNTNFKK